MVGMLYLGRGRLGLVYLAATLLIYGLPPVLAHLGLLPVSPGTASGPGVLLVTLVGAVHAYRLARGAWPFVPKAWFSRWYFLVLFILAPVALALAIRTFLWEPFFIPSASMEPSLAVGDDLFVSKFAYDVSEPQRGDIAVFRSPQDNRTDYIKRLIGLPGDRVQLRAGSLYLNGERVPREEVEAPQGSEDVGERYREKLTFERSYLIHEMSDQGRFDDTEVYEVPEGHYFFLGDNRDNSLDSRHPEFLGFVPRENLIGPVVLVYWNREAQKFRLVVPE